MFLNGTSIGFGCIRMVSRLPPGYQCSMEDHGMAAAIIVIAQPWFIREEQVKQGSDVLDGC